MRPILLTALLCACGNTMTADPAPTMTKPLPVENCLGKALLESFGKTSLMVGMSTKDDSVAGKAPFDVRYNYLTAGIADGAGPCSSCKSGCSSGGTSCAGGACGWWGCWQDDRVRI